MSVTNKISLIRLLKVPPDQLWLNTRPANEVFNGKDIKGKSGNHWTDYPKRSTTMLYNIVLENSHLNACNIINAKCNATNNILFM